MPRKSSFHKISINKKSEKDSTENLLKKVKLEGEVYSTTVRLPLELHTELKAIVAKKKTKIGRVLTHLVKGYVERELKKEE